MLNWERLRVTVTGGAGFLGRTVCKKLQERGCLRIDVPRRSEYDLTVAAGVEAMYNDLQPDVLLHLAAEVGGIGANRTSPGRFFYANLAMGLHLIEQARLRNLRKFVQVGTVCAYPKNASVPFREEELWNGFPEETNAPYGVAKKALFVMLDAYRQQYGMRSAVVVPVNLYGPHDNFNPETSHVIPALIRKCIEARLQQRPFITCWGSGKASREFLYVDDAAEGVLRAAETLDAPVPINLGTGQERSIRELVRQIARACQFHGEVQWDVNQPDGQPRRCLDISRAQQILEWKPETSFEEGLRRTVSWYEEEILT